ncbi:MAG: spermine synthase [Caldimicrobium sp.]|nr:spermine synthase [Caldimicrobium sp.]MDW8182011.1 spermine synthase [Caldimicrobium sp.]
MIRKVMSRALPSEGKGVRVFYGEFINVDYVFGYIGRLIHGESGLQNIYILENEFWGRMLFINNNLQFTSRDEFVYHEALVHIPMQSVPDGKIKKVLICGGGDYGAAREVLKYSCVEEVIIVDIDPRVPKLVEEYFPELLPENPKDPRLHLITEDAYVLVDQYVKEGKTFDLIIVDSTDPDIGESENIQELSHALFGIDFHQKLLKICPEGVIVQQCGTPFTMKNILIGVHRIYRSVYPENQIYIYRANVPSFGSDNAYIMRCPFEYPQIPKGKVIINTLYYDFAVHGSSFVLPKFWRVELGL